MVDNDDRQNARAAADLQWMGRALELAKLAREMGEVPVGAVLVGEGKSQLLTEGWNRPVSTHDPTAHAEIVALRTASEKTGNYRLPGTVLYVTLEPCAMCAGAIVQARVERVVFAAPDPKAGAAGSVFDVLGSACLNHRPVVEGGLLEDDAAKMLRAFFVARRRRTQQTGQNEQQAD